MSGNSDSVHTVEGLPLYLTPYPLVSINSDHTHTAHGLPLYNHTTLSEYVRVTCTVHGLPIHHHVRVSTYVRVTVHIPSTTLHTYPHWVIEWYSMHSTCNWVVLQSDNARTKPDIQNHASVVTILLTWLSCDVILLSSVILACIVSRTITQKSGKSALFSLFVWSIAQAFI